MKRKKVLRTRINWLSILSFVWGLVNLWGGWTLTKTFGEHTIVPAQAIFLVTGAIFMLVPATVGLTKKE